MKISNISQNGIELIAQFEGFRSKPYLCPAKVPTIGYGTTIYPGTKQKVTLQDPPITRELAIHILREDVKHYAHAVDNMTVDTISQNQFDALSSFAYNLGTEALRKSTLLKKVNINPNDKSIAKEFAKWINAAGKPLPGLIKRRQAESNLYFKI
jgi:lysozyme